MYKFYRYKIHPKANTVTINDFVEGWAELANTPFKPMKKATNGLDFDNFIANEAEITCFSTDDWRAEIEPLDIYTAAGSKEELIEELKQELEVIWIAYVEEDDDNLTFGAIEMKKWFIKHYNANGSK